MSPKQAEAPKQNYDYQTFGAFQGPSTALHRGPGLFSQIKSLAYKFVCMLEMEKVFESLFVIVVVD
jgi:hypothetical protein